MGDKKMINLNNEKRNQAMSLRGRAVGSDVVIFHAKTEKALSFLRLRGASGVQVTVLKVK